MKQICWVFSEVFVTSVSIVLAARFDQFTNRLGNFQGQVVPQAFWCKVRTDYLILSDLVREMDKYISPFLMVYCFCNLYFICEKLFGQVESDRNFSEKLFFLYSVLFLIGRTIYMLYNASLVNVSSKKAISIIRAAPTKNWGTDVRKFDKTFYNLISILLPVLQIFGASPKRFCKTIWASLFLSHERINFNGN